jgi:hypothetical protein
MKLKGNINPKFFPKFYQNFALLSIGFEFWRNN